MTAAETLPNLILQAEFARLVGERIRLARESLGLTQAELAEAIGVTRPAVTMVERGSNGTNLYRLYLICRVLGISAAEIVGV